MVTKSGLTLDYDTNQCLPNSQVVVKSVTTSSIIASGYSDPVGYFSFDVSVIGQNRLFYYISRSGYTGFSREFDKSINYINLYAKTPSTSGYPILTYTDVSQYTASLVRDFISTPIYIYAISEGGLDIIQKDGLINKGYISYNGGFTCIDSEFPDARSRTSIYLGTTDSGVMEFVTPTSYTGTLINYTSSLKQSKYRYPNYLQSNNVQKISVSTHNGVAVATPSGIDLITTDGRFKATFTGGATSLLISDLNNLYYSPTNSGLVVKSGTISSDWDSYDYMVCTTGTYSFPILSDYINDVKVITSGTQEHVFIATRSGLVCYTESGNLSASASNAKLFRSFP